LVNSVVSRDRAAAFVPGSPSATNTTILKVRQDWASRALPRVSRAARSPIPGRRLRVGYLSYLFHQPNWMKPIWGVIHAHDRQNFQVHLFSDTPEQSIGAEYRRHPDDVFHDICGLSNPDAAELIEQSGVDVLVDLNGYSAVWRMPLLAVRPAPAIVGWFNLFATSGMEAYDCLVGDAVVIPPEEERFYCERIARVPGTVTRKARRMAYQRYRLLFLSFGVDHPLRRPARPVEIQVGVEVLQVERLHGGGVHRSDVSVADVLADDRSILALHQSVVVARRGTWPARSTTC